ncbi:ABC transporter substrate-binding protein [Aureimonas populi]|uniref:ABC transporter substrate-binding protein n=1 Tax=Aureimonas populi TaxID=1701758 RepID=A0ABW5CNB8_9HYPH|nr:ABC transporter substrate-binding protein [Aureimonas populi]
MTIHDLPALARTLMASAALAVLAPAAHAQSAADVSGEITLMAYSGIFKDNYTAAVIEPFMELYPDVTVNYFGQPGSAQMLGTLRSQAGSPQTDVVIFDVSTSLIGNREGLLAPLSQEEVPNLADLVPAATVQEGYGPAVTFDSLVLIYNTRTVPEAPAGIADLWDPAHAGRIAATAMPSILGTGLMLITSSMLGEDYTESVEQAVAKLSELAPSVQTFDPRPDSYTLVLNGTVDIATGWNARAQTYAVQSDGLQGVVLPEEGSVLQINTINLTEGSANAQAAAAFIDYALSPEAQAAFTEAMYYAPVNALTEVSEEASARTSINEMDGMLPLDWAWVATRNDEWNQLWRRQIISAGN